MINKKLKYLLFSFLLLFGAIGCEQQTQKSLTITLDSTSHTFLHYDTVAFPFILDYSNEASIIIKKQEAGNVWFDLIYPKQQMTIYCSYLPITNNFRELDDDIRRFVYRHTVVATEIEEHPITITGKRVNGLKFNIIGEVASPIQFMLTDSTEHFLRGALYFDRVVPHDTALILTKQIEKDIDRMIESFEWRK